MEAALMTSASGIEVLYMQKYSALRIAGKRPFETNTAYP
jgi:hypothetical protein